MKSITCFFYSCLFQPARRYGRGFVFAGRPVPLWSATPPISGRMVDSSYQTLAEAGDAVAELIEHEVATAPSEEPKVHLGASKRWWPTRVTIDAVKGYPCSGTEEDSTTKRRRPEGWRIAARRASDALSREFENAVRGASVVFGSGEPSRCPRIQKEEETNQCHVEKSEETVRAQSTTPSDRPHIREVPPFAQDGSVKER